MTDTPNETTTDQPNENVGSLFGPATSQPGQAEQEAAQPGVSGSGAVQAATPVPPAGTQPPGDAPSTAGAASGQPVQAQQQQGGTGGPSESGSGDVSALRDELAALREQVRAQGAATAAMQQAISGIVPEHAGGPGVSVHQSWGQRDQELAREGNHPLQKERRDRE